MDRVKEATIKIGDLDVNIAVVNGIGNVGQILDQVQSGTSKHHFIEVMACPGGCINGGGQPIHQNPEKVMKRIKALHRIDENAKTRRSHENESVKTLYKEFFGEPNSHKAHEILHTEYFDKKKILRN